MRRIRTYATVCVCKGPAQHGTASGRSFSGTLSVAENHDDNVNNSGFKLNAIMIMTRIHCGKLVVSELFKFITSSATYSHGDSPMTSVANTATMTILALHTSQPHIFYNTEI